MSQAVRVRFAPSPTGMLHIGAVRTALFAWLYARQQNGQFYLRIEDTDKSREVKGAVDNIKQSLQWLGLEWDGDEVYQSRRLELYHSYAQKLIARGLAYADPYSEAELQQFRNEAVAKKKPFLYRNHRPLDPPEWDGNQPLRFKVAGIGTSKWQDEVRGQLTAGTEALDDFIILKSDGYPTYNFAHIVDDEEMGISHIFRADEFIASVPKYLSLYRALDIKPPKFVTLPAILGREGTKKLSKREGAAGVLEYKDQGFLPSALNNFLALLGWNDGSQQEIYTAEELIKAFSIDRIQSSPAHFDYERLLWINAHHIRKSWQKDPTDLLAQLSWPKSVKLDKPFKTRLLEVEHERMKTLSDLAELPDYYLKTPSPTQKALAEFKLSKDWLENVIEIIGRVGDKDRSKLEGALRDAVGQRTEKPAQLFGLLRVAITNADRTPPIWDLVYVLGQAEATQRLEKAAKLL